MTQVTIQHSSTPLEAWETWRFKAREALIRGIHPDNIDFEDPADTLALRIPFSPASGAVEAPRTPHPHPHVPAAFLFSARIVAASADFGRWNLLYRLLWRLQEDRQLLRNEEDEDVALLHRLEREVRASQPTLELTQPFLFKKESQRADAPNVTTTIRIENMMLRSEKTPTAAPYVPQQHTLPLLRESMHDCKGCDLYKHATQVVPGEGSAHAQIMLIGEQPGDQEDHQGKPFVGPAGKMLRGILDELHIDPKKVYITNAIKHFKHTDHGKRRVGQAPLASEITACKPWLHAEIDAIKPRIIVCLGAVAAKSLLGNGFRLMKQRGKLVDSPFAPHVLATIHPSAVLRAENRDELYKLLKSDLAFANDFVLRKSA